MLLIITSFFFSDTLYAQEIYHFDKTAIVNGCSNVTLQKIAADNQYEVVIELTIDSIPKFTELDISKYSKFINIWLNKYKKGNRYINGICNDAIRYDPDAKKPDTYLAVHGTFTITKWKEKELIISAELKNVVLENDTKQTIKLPAESFDQLTVGWMGG